MNQADPLMLHRLARQTPNELRQENPELFAQLRAQADDQLRMMLVAAFANASDEVRQRVAQLDLATQGEQRAVRQALLDAFQAEDVPLEVAREGLGRVLGAEEVGRLDDPLQPDTPLEVHPLFQERLVQARTLLLGTMTGLNEAKVEAILARDVTVETLHDGVLESLVANGDLADDEASRLGLVAAFFHLTGDLSVTEMLQSRRFARLDNRPVAYLRDLARLNRRDWLNLVRDANPELPEGMDVEAYADLLRRKVTTLYPGVALLASLLPERPERLADDLEKLQPLLERNQNMMSAPSFAILDQTGLDAPARRQARQAYDRLKRLANTHPGLQLHGVLDNPNLDPVAKVAQVIERLGWLERIQEQNPGVQLLALDYTPGSPDLDALNFDGLAIQEQRMAVNTLKAYQRTYALTADVDDVQAILAAGYHAAVAIARERPADLARATGLEESKVHRYYQAARAQGSAVATLLGTVLDVVQDGLLELNVDSLGPDVQDFLRRLPGYEELFGSQAYCQCERCQSVLSPAAYFVDLMRFVEQKVLEAVFTGNRRNHVLNLRVRRPDLWNLPLTCQNTDEPIPTLEIINEVLENYIARRRGYAGALTDRRSVEQVVYEQALSQVVDSCRQPFLLPLAKLHIYLEHFDRPLATIARILEASVDTVARATLKISQREYQLITQPNIGLNFLRQLYGIPFQVQPAGVTAFNAQELLRPMGLTRNELTELLQTHFVNPPGAQAVQIRAEKRDANSVQNDIERIYNLTPAALDRMHRFTRLWRQVGWKMAEVDVALESLSAAGLAQGLDANALARLAELLAVQGRFKTSVEETLALCGALPQRLVVPNTRPLFDRLFNLPPFERLDGPLPRPAVRFVHPSFRQAGAAAPADNTLNRLLAGLRVSDENLALLISHLAGPLGANLAAANENDRGFLLTAANLALLYSHARLAERLKLPVADFFQLLDHANRAGVIPAGYVRHLADVMASLDFYDWQHDSSYSLDDVGFISGGRVLLPANYLQAQGVAEDVLRGVQTDNALVFADTVLAYLPGATEDDSRRVIVANANAGVLEALGDGNYRLATNFDPNAPLNIPAGVPIQAADALDQLLNYHASRIIPNQLAARLNLPVAKLDALFAMVGPDLNDPALALALRNTNPANDRATLAALVAGLLPLAILFRREVFDPPALNFIRMHSGAAHFNIADFTQLTISNVRRISVYAAFTDTAREARFTPIQPPINPLEVQQVIDDFDPAAAFANADPAMLARVLRAEVGLVLTLLANVTLPADAPGALGKLARVVEVARYLGVGGEALRLMLSNQYADLTRAADAVLGAFRAKYNDEQTWQAQVEPYDDRFRSRRRDALADYLIHSIQPEFASRNDLYHHFLIDPSLEGCARTSRLVAAISSVQLYIHRCLMNLEQDSRDPADPAHVGVDPALIPADEWSWRKNYRVWEANRKVFLFPENYIEPELRDDKTPLFEQLESTLLQQEINEQTVLDAYAAYMSGFEEVARLKIAGSYHDKNTTAETDVLHLFGTTPADPPIYYYRTAENILYNEGNADRPVSWSPWRKIDVQIPTRKVAPIVYRGKLYVFWVEIATTVLNRVANAGSEFAGYKHMLILKYTNLRLDGTWSAPQKVTLDGIFGIRGDGAVRDDLIPITDSLAYTRFDRQRNHIEPLDGYSLTGYRWDQVYPQTLPGLPLYVFTGSLFLHLFPDYNYDFPAAGGMDFYHKRVYWPYGPYGPTYAVATGLLYIRPGRVIPPGAEGLDFAGPGTDRLLFNYTRIFPLEMTYALCSFHLERSRLQEREWTGGEINDFERRLDPSPLLRLWPAMEVAVVNGAISELVLDEQGDLLLLSYAPNGGQLPYVLRRIGTTLSETVAEQLFIGGVDPLLETGYQLSLKEARLPVDILNYTRLAVTDPHLPADPTRLDFTGPYGVYYREIFFHIPFLIANHLNSQGKFAAAQRWYHYIFNPTAADTVPGNLPAAEQAQWRRDRPWRYREFRNRTLPTLRQILTDGAAIAAYKRDPFNPHAIARLRLGAFQKCIVMKYIDNLLDWGDNLFAQFTTESLIEATLLYVMAADILGERPAQLGDCGEGQVQPRDYASIGPLMNEASEFLIEFETFYLGVGHLPVLNRQEVNYHYTLSHTVLGDTLPAVRRFDAAALALGDGNGAGAVQVAQSEGIFRGYGWQPSRTATWERRIAREEGNGEVVRGSQEARVIGHDSPLLEAFARAQDFGLTLASQVSPVFCVPPNRDLLGYWKRVEDHLYNIRNCRDITGAVRQPALFAPEIDPRLLVRARAAGLSLEDVLNAISGDLPPYRFSYLIERAKAFTAVIQSFGAALLSALEKKDVEELNRLRTIQQQNLLKLTTQVREGEVQAAEEGVQLVDRQQQAAQYRRDYYQELLDISLIPTERVQQVSRHAASISQVLADILSGTAGVLHLIPQLGSPFAMKYGGAELGSSAKNWATMLRDTARVAEIIAGSAGLEATFQRRDEGWEHQRDLADHELKQLEKQCVIAEIRRDIAQRSLEMHQSSIEQLEEVFDFYADKFSSLGLYTWLASTLQRVYRDAYNSAFAMARLAEQAFRFERGEESGFFLGATYWDATHAGLLAGERLLIDLQAMEQRYIETNYRNLEIDQAFSLTQLDPAALIALRETGRCEFTVGELFFDLFYPGQYRRRIKSVRLTIPCITGPYTNVGATLSLEESWLRNEPILGAANLRPVPPRRSVSIATSTAQNDAGVFEFSFRDERYMPFEGAGAVSRWRLELPRSFRQFDYQTINDVIVHISYTAEQDGALRTQVENLQDVVEGQLLHTLQNNALARVFNLRQDFSVAFHRLLHSPANTPIRVEITDKHFPIFLQERNLTVTGAILALEVADGQTVNNVAFTINGTAVAGFAPEATLSNLHAVDLGNLFAGGVVGPHTFVVTNAGDLAPAAPPANDPSVFDADKLGNILLYVEYTVALPGP